MDKQKIKANGIEIPVDKIIGRREKIGDTLHDILDIKTNEPLSVEQVSALRADDAWVLVDTDGQEHMQGNYTELLECTYSIAQVDPNLAVIKEKENQIKALNEERAQLVEEKQQIEAEKEAQVSALEHKVTAVATTLLRGATREKAMPLAEYIPDWAPGPFEEGDIRKDAGQIYQLIDGKAHDATNQPDWRPSQQPSLWFLWHGISRETAMPFVPVTGAHDIYKAGEWMILDEEYYEALEDTAYSPKDYARAWKKRTMQEHGRNGKIWNIR